MALLGRFAGKCCRSLLSDFSKGGFCGVSQPGWLQCCIEAKRHLLSENVIRLQEFQQKKLAVAHKITGSEGNFLELFKQKMQRNELILRDELKLLLHLCERPEDMEIAREAVFRYNKENRFLMHGDFRFGPVFMRLCYELEQEELAAATITDKDMKGFFIEPTSFNIAIDMLFIKGSYKRAMDILRTMKDQGLSFNKDTVMLATAVCYKLNTADSYKTCTDLIEEQQTKGQMIPRRACCFAVALALRQNDTEKARSLYLQILNMHGKLSLNLKVVILTMAGDVSGAISLILAARLPKNSFFVKKMEFSQEVVDLLLLRTNGSQLQKEVEEIVSQLEEDGQVTEQTLDNMLCSTPGWKRKPFLMENRKKISQRTLRPQQLFSE
ncbi:pentatricopeptide repeat-containing protein 2, mitochondrial [Kryptolebias marmoratus]|uniref:Pentatricopeptide repeat domain 2 n=1 Tax=Kryptolebias marmoratus TaxID=37003 RepID=A0A3Q3A7I6_KRYMA|nr:pentatricopeptide repeat-containing protein 2, mitochondrial [Kryptolebias marmoratus]